MNKYVTFDVKEGALQSTRGCKSAVFVFVYYEETFNEYKSFFENISSDIALYLITSNPNLIDNIQEYQSERKNTFVLQSDNRGRDVAALLVTARPYILQYDVFCFLHDKKEKEELQKSYVDAWRYLLWENMLASEEYVNQIINYMYNNNQVGMLFPPAPVGEYATVWNTGFWGINYINANDVYHKIGIRGDISEKEEPLSIGTVFWAKVDALRPLLEYNWKTEDFPQEPLPDDGTISHAIERVLPFVAEAQGYESQICVTSQFLVEYVGKMSREYRCAAGILNKELGLHSGESITNYYKNKQKFLDYATRYEDLYIYGAGSIGDECRKYMETIGLKVKGFIVSKKTYGEKNGLPIYDLEEVRGLMKVGVIVAARADNRLQMVKSLEGLRYDDYYIYR